MRRLACAIGMMVALAACTTRYQKRGTELPLPAKFTVEAFEHSARDNVSGKAAQLDLEARSIERFKTTNGIDFSLGVIEFTDDGFINRGQYDQVLRHVRSEMDASDSKGTLLVIFAHGWHHSCRTCDRDIACFRRVLDELADNKDFHQGRRVVGVYLGWRGASLLGKLNLLTLWERKRIAEHIGRTGAKEVLNEFHEEWRRRNIENPTRPVTMITVGHSLGGAMVFAAVKDKLSGNVDDIVHPGRSGTFRVVRAEESRFDAMSSKNKALRARFGDLVVLVNPAIESAEYAPFDDDLAGSARKGVSDGSKQYSDQQRPILVTFASAADTAVGRLFPLSRWISTINLPRNGRALWRRSERVGLGRYRPHITHRLEYGRLERENGSIVPKPREKYTDQPPGCDCTKDWGGLGEEAGADPLPVPIRDGNPNLGVLPIYTDRPQVWPSSDGVSVMRFRLTDERIHRGWDVYSPYLVINTDAGVINEHSDIFNPIFVTFLAEYLGGIGSAPSRTSPLPATASR
jgi:hypothetical protein